MRIKRIILLILPVVLLWALMAAWYLPGNFRDALRNGELDTVRSFLKYGEDVNGRVEYPGRNRFMTPLSIVAQNGDYHLAKLLISFGASPAVTNSRGNTPLLEFLGADDQPWDRKLFLLLLPPDLNTVNVEGQTALLYAVAYRDEYYVAEIIERGGQINYQDTLGQTALHGAKTPAIAQLLLQSGADRSIVDNEKRTASEVAILEKRMDVAQAIDEFLSIR